MSAVDYANDSSSQQPLITSLADSGAEGHKRGENASLAGWCTEHPVSLPKAVLSTH